jgi:hypothetical protein
MASGAGCDSDPIDAGSAGRTEPSAFEARCRVAPGAATPPTCAYVIAIVAAGYALRSPASRQALEAALAATAVMTVEGAEGVAHAAQGPAQAGLWGRPGTRSYLPWLSRGNEGDTPLRGKALVPQFAVRPRLPREWAMHLAPPIQLYGSGQANAPSRRWNGRGHDTRRAP